MVVAWHTSRLMLWPSNANGTKTIPTAIPLLSTFVSSSTCPDQAVWPWTSCTCLRLWGTGKKSKKKTQTGAAGFASARMPPGDLSHVCPRAGTGSFGGLSSRVNVSQTSEMHHCFPSPIQFYKCSICHFCRIHTCLLPFPSMSRWGWSCSVGMTVTFMHLRLVKDWSIIVKKILVKI